MIYMVRFDYATRLWSVVCQGVVLSKGLRIDEALSIAQDLTDKNIP